CLVMRLQPQVVLRDLNFLNREYPVKFAAQKCRSDIYLYPTKIFDAPIVSEMPLLENVGFENPIYGC
ncbi:hypothetical protein V3K70_002154, partial [Neisseria gonorrhoeae]